MNFLDSIYEFFEEFSTLFVILFSFFGEMGLPIGTTFFVVWAGSITNSYLFLIFLIFIVLLFSVIGDFLSFLIGKKYGCRLLKKYEKSKKLNKIHKKTSNFFLKYGTLGVFLSRFLITGISPYINYVAGIENYNQKKFLVITIFGKLIYSILFVLIGFILKDSWEVFLEFVTDFSYLIILIIIFYFIVKTLFNLLKNSKSK